MMFKLDWYVFWWVLEEFFLNYWQNFKMFICNISYLFLLGLGLICSKYCLGFCDVYMSEISFIFNFFIKNCIVFMKFE